MTLSAVESSGALGAAVEAFAAAVTFTPLTSGPIDHSPDPALLSPPNTSYAVRTTFEGATLMGEVFVLIDEEFSERLVYAAVGIDNLSEALVPALTGAFGHVAALAGTSLDVGDPIESTTVDPAKWMESGDHTLAGRLFDGEDHVASIVFILTPVAGPEVEDTPESVPETASLHAPQFPAVLDAHANGDKDSLALLRDVAMEVTAEFGRTSMTVREVLALAPGAIVELDRIAGAPVDLLVNRTLIARGEVVVIDEEYGVRVTEIVTRAPGIST